MKSHVTIAFLALLSLIAGCQVASNHDRNIPTTNTPNATAEGAGTLKLYSGIHRDNLTPPIIYGDENSNRSSVAYHQVPMMEFDDEATTDVFARPNIVCGVAVGQSIASRMADCLKVNGNRSTWDGSALGRTTESLWKLVSFNDSGREVWQDVRTGMLWSDVIGTGNWCQAAGNEELPQGAVTINCSDLAATKKLCINLVVSGLPDVSWRLPSRNDFLQADVDGLRFALKKILAPFWTATLNSSKANRSEAWAYNQVPGTLVAEPLTDLKNIRCIGVPTK